MSRYFTAFFCRVGLALFATTAHAEEVALDFNGLTLLADFVEAEDASGQVVLITHGTLAHKDMELVETLQESFSEQGVSSLAHTLSLNIDARRGMFDCEQTHTHRDEDADGEIGAWIDWLKGQGQDQIALVGHSRGGRQVARTAATRNDITAAILIAPATVASAEHAYQRSPTLEGAVLQSNDEPPLTYVKTAQFLYCETAQATFESHESYHPKVATGAETYTPEISVPILVIAGGKDTVVPGVPRIFIPLRSNDLQFKLIEDADHMFLDFYADDAATLIAEFLADLSEKPAEPDFAAADLAYGEYLGGECVACHAGGEGIPPIAGGDAAYLYEALEEYAKNSRKSQAMGLVARSLDQEQRIAVAAYLSSLDAD